MKNKIIVSVLLVALVICVSVVVCITRCSNKVTHEENTESKTDNSATTTISIETESSKEHFDEIITESSGEDLLEEETSSNETIMEPETENLTQGVTESFTEGSTQKPTVKPTEAPTQKPTVKPTETPTQKPTVKPTEVPTQKPTENPTTTDEDKETKELAKNILGNIVNSSMSELEKVCNIYVWMVENVEFASEYAGFGVGKDYTLVSEPKHVLKNKRAVGYGYANTFKLLAELAGIETLYIKGMYSIEAGSGSHAWNQVKINGLWYNLDTCYDSSMKYFLVSDEVFGERYIENSSINMSCTKSYDRMSVYKTMADIESKKKGVNITFVETDAQAIEAMEAMANSNVKKVEIWYFSETFSHEMFWDKFNELIKVIPYPYQNLSGTNPYGSPYVVIRFEYL